MQYHGKLPEVNNNVSHEHPLKEFFILLFGSALVVLVIYWVMGLFVDLAVDSISPETEVNIFEAVSDKSISISPSNSATSEKRKLAQQLVDDLSRCVDIPYSIKLDYVESKEANAFAAPGGKMVLFSGLLDNIQSENGLAFVLAHELAHFKNRDHLRGLGRGIVLMALSVLTTGNSDLTRLMIPVNQLGTAQFSQTREQAADTTALAILECHYGHVSGATEFFETIIEPEEILPMMHYFSSHPEAERRIATINEMSIKKAYHQGRVKALAWSEKLNNKLK